MTRKPLSSSASAPPRRRSLPGALCSRQEALQAYRHVRSCSEAIAEPLAIEDMVVQSMADVSPTRWHLAHTSWFFQTFVLESSGWDYPKPDPLFGYLFNSYYDQVGAQFPRPQRGLLTRPTVKEILNYRRETDAAIEAWIGQTTETAWRKFVPVLVLGLHHEQQHQELMLTDIKHVLFANPLRPAAYEAAKGDSGQQMDIPPLEFERFPGGIHLLGAEAAAEEAFFFDCEGPRHQVLLNDFDLATRPVTNREYLQFIEAGGYRNPALWAADGWGLVQRENWQHPLYWSRNKDGRWQEFTLYGMRDLSDSAPVCHLSWYEAQAYAGFCRARLPLEAELELALSDADSADDSIEAYHPQTLCETAKLQPAGVWEWTGSAFLPYPGFAAAKGALGEYNGKFMSGQMVLKGGSCLTPAGHIRRSYRNFFPPAARWQMSGVRLARDV